MELLIYGNGSRKIKTINKRLKGIGILGTIIWDKEDHEFCLYVAKRDLERARTMVY